MQASSPMQVKLKALLAVYLIVPLCLGIVVVDQVFLNGQVRALLPRDPTSLLLYALIFNVPHIIASFFSLAEREYLLFYKKRLLYEVPILLGIAFLGYQFVGYWILILGVIYTEYHQLSQQIGIGRFYFKTKLPEYNAWRILAVILATIGYGLVYQQVFPSDTFSNTVMIPLALATMVPFVLLSVSMYVRITARSGKYYFGTIMGGIGGALLMLFTGYPAFVIFCTRVEHDIPAFMAYIVHDYNRHKENAANVLYRLFAFTRVPIFVLSPLLAIGIAFLLARIPLIAGALIFAVSMVHYYIEGFIWKNGSIHRRYLNFV